MTTTHESGNQRRGARPPTHPARPAADYRPRVLSFAGGDVDARAFIADHLNGITPSSELYVDESGLVLCRRVAESTEEEES